MKYLVLMCFLIAGLGWSQDTDEAQFEKLYNESLSNGMSYNWLNYLSNRIGGRMAGSVQAEQAVEYAKEQLDSLGLDRVWLQPVMVPKWVRGTPEFAYIESKPGITNRVNITALGGSVGTPLGGLKAPVVEVMGLEELETLGREKLQGKIVFFNRPMEPALIDTFEAYRNAVDQRSRGAQEATKYGAAGVIVRSMTFRQDDLPHTGQMNYGDTPLHLRIPAAAISTNDADLLSTTLKLNPNINFYFKQNCKQLDPVKSYNVIGEVRGSTYPNEIIVVGGHLDSWDLGDGAHDDGAGCVQSMEVVRLFQAIGYKPKRTIRIVLFMAEENGLWGGKEYAARAAEEKATHIFALESDAGGFSPRGFGFESSDANYERIRSWAPLFEPYLVHQFVRGGGGPDINPLKDGKIVLAGLRPDAQRYFDHHHAENDTFAHINRRELELGAASMAALVYLVDKYGTLESQSSKGR